MGKMVFQSDRCFTLFDYFISHGQLLIRSRIQENENNIDIIFFDTSYIQMTTVLYGLAIKEIKKDSFTSTDSVNMYLGNDEGRVFEIRSGKEVYYIAASFVKLYENNLGANETSLGMIYKGRDKLIASSD